jgi:hypothetical protein
MKDSSSSCRDLPLQIVAAMVNIAIFVRLDLAKGQTQNLQRLFGLFIRDPFQM